MLLKAVSDYRRMVGFHLRCIRMEQVELTIVCICSIKNSPFVIIMIVYCWRWLTLFCWPCFNMWLMVMQHLFFGVFVVWLELSHGLEMAYDALWKFLFNAPFILAAAFACSLHQSRVMLNSVLIFDGWLAITVLPICFSNEQNQQISLLFHFIVFFVLDVGWLWWLMLHMIDSWWLIALVINQYYITITHLD